MTAPAADGQLRRRRDRTAAERVLASGGAPLEPRLRAEMEQRLGHAFGHVRVHDDPLASESARSLGAAAYTVGRDVVFAAGRFAPETRAGRDLLAHELVHTLQQRFAASEPNLELASEHDAFERAAERIAAGAGEAPAPLPAGAPALQRQPANAASPPAQQQGPRPPEITERDKEEIKADVERIVEELRATFTDEWKIVKILLYWDDRDRVHQEQTGYAGTAYLDAFLLQTKLRAYSHRATGAPWAEQWGIVYDDVWHELGAERRRIWKDRVAKSRQGSDGPREGPAENFWKTLSRQEAIGMWGMLKGMGTAAATGFVDSPASAIVKALQQAGIPVDTPASAAEWLGKQYDITGEAAFGKDWTKGEALFLGMSAADIGTAGGAVVWQLVMMGKGKGGAAWAQKALQLMGILGSLDGVATSANRINELIVIRQQAGKPIEVSDLVADPEFRKAASGLIANAIGAVAAAAGMKGSGAAATPAAQAAAKMWAKVGIAVDAGQLAEQIGRLIQVGLSDKPPAVKDKEISTALAEIIQTGISLGHGAAEYRKEYGGKKPSAGGDEEQRNKDEQRRLQEEQARQRTQQEDEQRRQDEQRKQQEQEQRRQQEPPGEPPSQGGGGGAPGGRPRQETMLVGPVGKRGDVPPTPVDVAKSPFEAQERKQAKTARKKGVIGSVEERKQAQVRKQEKARAAKFREQGGYLVDELGNRLGKGGRKLPPLTAAEAQRKRREAVTAEPLIQRPGETRAPEVPEGESLITAPGATKERPDVKVTLSGEPDAPKAVEILGPDEKPAGSRVQVRVERPLTFDAPVPAGAGPRGLAYEARVLTERYPDATKLPANFTAFDAVEGGRVTTTTFIDAKGNVRQSHTIEGGRAVSIKSVDLTAESFKTGDKLYSALDGYLDKVIKYPMTSSGEARATLTAPVGEGGARVTLVAPREKVVHLELMQTPNAEQLAGLSRLQNEAAGRNVTLVVVAPNGPVIIAPKPVAP
jgi:hypothetical protein